MTFVQTEIKFNILIWKRSFIEAKGGSIDLLILQTAVCIKHQASGSTLDHFSGLSIDRFFALDHSSPGPDPILGLIVVNCTNMCCAGSIIDRHTAGEV